MLSAKIISLFMRKNQQLGDRESFCLLRQNPGSCGAFGTSLDPSHPDAHEAVHALPPKIHFIHFWGTGSRTPIKGFKGLCPTIRRSPNKLFRTVLPLDLHAQAGDPPK